MKELGFRARVLIFGVKLGNEMWAEAMHHGNLLRNRLPSQLIQGITPILSRNSRMRIDFINLLIFCQHGFAFFTSQTHAGTRSYRLVSLMGNVSAWKVIRSCTAFACRIRSALSLFDAKLSMFGNRNSYRM